MSEIRASCYKSASSPKILWDPYVAWPPTVWSRISASLQASLMVSKLGPDPDTDEHNGDEVILEDRRESADNELT